MTQGETSIFLYLLKCNYLWRDKHHEKLHEISSLSKPQNISKTFI